MICNKSPVLRAPNGPAKSGLYHNLDVAPVGVSSWVGKHMAWVIRTVDTCKLEPVNLLYNYHVLLHP